jgi:lysozyme family protein
MADFEGIIQWILFQEDNKKEPGKIIDLGDGGGLTRLGLTQHWHQIDLPINFFTTMVFKDAVVVAKKVYRIRYWSAIDGDLIASDQVAAPLLSFAINDTPQIAIKTLQAVLEINQDGFMGPRTMAELNSKDPGATANLFRAAWMNFYHNDCELNPDKAQFLSGWIARATFPYPSELVPDIYATI